jgi:hypothetical protein
MIAADIDDCIGETQAAVQHWAQLVTENLRTQLQLWESTFVQFNDELETERTVRNWKIPTHEMIYRIPNANQDQTAYASDTFLAVYGAVCAVKYAEIDGRISTAQRDQVVADWNAAWGF